MYQTQDVNISDITHVQNFAHLEHLYISVLGGFFRTHVLTLFNKGGQ